MRGPQRALLWLSAALIVLSKSYAFTFPIPQNPKPVSGEDDFCDSIKDPETRSAACSFATVQQALFVCENKGYPQQKLYLSRVGDGICDCCDGSDEAQGVCANTCEEEYRAVREKEAAEARERAEGVKARELLKKESQKAFWGLKAKADVAKVDREKYSAERQELFQKIEEKEMQQEELKQAQRESLQGVLQASLAHLGAEHAHNVLVALAQRSDESDMEKLLDAIRPFYPEGVTADETAALFLVVGDNDSGALDEDADTIVDVETDVSGETVQAAGSEKPKSLAEALRLSSVPQASLAEITARFACEANMCKPLVDKVCEFAAGSKACGEISKTDCGSLHVISDELIEMRKRQAEINDKFNEADTIARDFDQAERKSWGEDDIWFSMRDECVDFDHNKYKYNICLFKRAKQDNTSLGTFSEIARDNATGKLTFKFEHGDRCFVNNRARTLDIEVICGAETSISSVDEPETCAYFAIMKSPVACV